MRPLSSSGGLSTSGGDVVPSRSDADVEALGVADEDAEHDDRAAEVGRIRGEWQRHGAAADGQDLPTEPFRNTGRRQASEGGRDERTVGGHDVRSRPAHRTGHQGLSRRTRGAVVKGSTQPGTTSGGTGVGSTCPVVARTSERIVARKPATGVTCHRMPKVTHETQQSTAAAPATVAVTTRRRVAAVAVRAGRRSRIVPTRAARATATAALTRAGDGGRQQQ